MVIYPKRKGIIIEKRVKRVQYYLHIKCIVTQQTLQAIKWILLNY